MEKITEYCTGCRACEQICPVSCITMPADKEGFISYHIDQFKCIDCGKCVRTCPQNHADTLFHNEVKQKVLACKLHDKALLFRSASGGAFSGIATRAIKAGWVVFGAAFDDRLFTRHTSATTEPQLFPLLSSKYVQSDTLDTFTEVRRMLKEGAKVLYSGTGCQIAGLRAFLGKNYDNLVTVDIVCHGVPSPLLFKTYISYLSAKHQQAQISYYDFRDKAKGWGLGLRYDVDGRKRLVHCELDPYYHYFLEGCTYRECCYRCEYARRERVSDLTLADYWGIEREHPEFNDIRGVSLLLINTEKGSMVWEKVKNDFDWLESTFEQASRRNGNLLHPTIRPEVRNYIYGDIDKLSPIEYFAKRFPMHISWKTKIKSSIPPAIYRFLKKSK